jgi:hypothetical protein
MAVLCDVNGKMKDKTAKVRLPSRDCAISRGSKIAEFAELNKSRYLCGA